MTDAPKPQADEPHDVSAEGETVQAEPAIESHDPEVSPEAVAQPVDADLIQVDGEPEPVIEVVEEPIPVDNRVHDVDYVEAVEADAVEAAAEPGVAESVDSEAAPVEGVAEAIEPVDYAHQASPEIDPIIEAGSLEPAISLPLSEPISEPVTESFEEAPAVTTEPEAEPTAASDPAAEAAVLGVAAAAAGAASGRRPIWSDQGDAPFNDGPEKPVYDRRSGASTKTKEGEGAGGEMGEIVKTVVFALLIAFVLRVLLFQPFTIPSASMEPNLYEGDYIVVSKWSYGYSRYSIPFAPPLFEGRLFSQTPTRGDIVVFKLPRDNKTDYIKRLIGLPGDRIQMVSNKLYINGQPVDDVVVSQSQINDIFGPRPVTQVRETLPGGKAIRIQDFGPGNELDDTPVYEVPAGHYFMMGDNRDNSIDSRVDSSSGVGLVPAENLVGKAQIILFSWTPGAAFLKPWTWFTHLRPSRFFTILH